MTPRKAPSTAETESGRIEEANNRLAEEIASLNDRLKTVQNAIDDAATDIVHAVRSLIGEQQLHYPIVKMSKDPASRNWKVERGREPSVGVGKGTNGESHPLTPAPAVQSKLSEVRCDVCDTEIPIEEARKAGWTDIAPWNGGEKPYLGICPCCHEDAGKVAKQVTATGPKRTSLFD